MSSGRMPGIEPPHRDQHAVVLADAERAPADAGAQLALLARAQREENTSGSIQVGMKRKRSASADTGRR
jgi:hypothetical protein